MRLRCTIQIVALPPSLPSNNRAGRTMEGRDGDASQTEDSQTADTDSSSSTEVDEQRLPVQWLSEEWLPGERLPEWGDPRDYRTRTIAMATLMVVLLAGIGGGGYYWYQELQEERRQKRMRKITQKFGDPIYWTENTINTLDAEFRLVTKWLPNDTKTENSDYRNGEMKYRLRIYGYPEALKNAWNSEFSPSYFVTIQLLDEDNFEVSSIKITLDEMTRTVNPKGEGIGFSVQGSQVMSLGEYRRIDDWKITWNL